MAYRISRRRVSRYRRKGPYGSRDPSNVSKKYRDANVFLNPFNRSTVGAKIPDGSVTLSCGIRLQKSALLLSSVDEFDYLLILPSHESNAFFATEGFTTSSTTEGAPLLTAISTFATYFPKDVTSKSIKTEEDMDVSLILPGPSSEIAKWRLVSSGARITQIANTDSNAGTFEAVRISLPALSTKGTFEEREDALSESLVIALNHYATDDYVHILNEPSYVTGKTSDIHKYIFQLRPQGSTNDFIEASYDTNFDGIFIRFNKVGGTPVGVQQFLCHFVHNLEVVYKPTSCHHAHHTECVLDRSFNAHKLKSVVPLKACYKSLAE